MAEQRRRILLNFKNTEDDIALYEFLKAKSSQSGYIKDVLKEKLDQEGIVPQQEQPMSQTYESTKKNSIKGLM